MVGKTRASPCTGIFMVGVTNVWFNLVEPSTHAFQGTSGCPDIIAMGGTEVNQGAPQISLTTWKWRQGYTLNSSLSPSGRADEPQIGNKRQRWTGAWPPHHHLCAQTHHLWGSTCMDAWKQTSFLKYVPRCSVKDSLFYLFNVRRIFQRWLSCAESMLFQIQQFLSFHPCFFFFT